MPQISGADKEKCSEAPQGLNCSLTQDVAVQLSRPLLAARQHPTAEDNTASRRLCLQSSRLHQSEDVEDVSRLPVAPGWYLQMITADPDGSHLLILTLPQQLIISVLTPLIA
ncbi:hypothetical protein D4764_05G0010500 [Takifugu flavidus]|uniref:Uncharacterized protein n=1 Tax=Takifugu flavidus TaxID=433684 RepID=A0A5C6N5E2_9TELE|nr:hypothetical protein D4764_05G0010500 [Takifugu flavidus]